MIIILTISRLAVSPSRVTLGDQMLVCPRPDVRGSLQLLGCIVITMTPTPSPIPPPTATPSPTKPLPASASSPITATNQSTAPLSTPESQSLSSPSTIPSPSTLPSSAAGVSPQGAADTPGTNGANATSNSNTNIGMTVVQLAKAHLTTGTYIMGAPPRNWASEDPNSNAPTNFDCSGFAGWAWYWGTGGKVNMHGQTSADWSDSSGKYQKFTADQKSQLQPGDLVYFAGAGGTMTDPGHVGIYEGSGGCGASDCFLEYYSTGKPGKEDSLAARTDFVGLMRPVVN